MPLALSGLLAVALVQRDASAALGTGVGLLIGAAAYTAVFAWLGLASRHAIVVGLVYVFVWEASLAAYLDGVRFLSLRRYTLGVTRALDDHLLRTMDTPLAPRAAAIGAAVAVVGGSLLAVRKLSRMDVP